MKFRNQFLKYKLNLKDEGGEGGGGGGEDQTAVIADLQKQMTALKSKNDELLGETKQAKTAKREAEDMAKTASEEALKKAGDFEALYKSGQTENVSIKEQLESMKNGIASEKKNTAALLMANEMADGFNAELLSEQIGKRLRYTDEGLKVTDASGNLTVSSVDDLKREFLGNEKYKSLLKGNQSSGGGATGGSNGSGASNEHTLNEVEGMNPQERADFFRKKGASVVN